MQDLKKLGMTELIALHNKLAESLGVATETSFKSLGAARNAITTLETKANKAMNQDDTNPLGTTDADADTDPNYSSSATPSAPPAPASAAGDQKYNSSGKRGPNQGVGAYAKELIVQGLNNADALKAVLAKFPDAKTTTGCIAFYRTALTKVPGGVSPEKLRADAQKLMDQAQAIETARAAAAADAAAKAAEAAAATAAATAAAAATTAVANAEPAPM